jgi:ubiquinone/menaquinone biosynthesis C-methylase UbiE
MFHAFVSVFLAFTASLCAYEDYSKLAQLYAQNQAAGTDYLAFRDVPLLMNSCLPEEKKLSVLDYGCGAGLSTRFIKKLVPEDSCVVGVDISEDMLKQAILADNTGTYFKMDQNIPFPDMTFDFVYCNFVLFELPNYSEIIRVLSEIRRTMQPEACLIATTGTPEMYNRQNHWATLDPNFPENDQLHGGSLAKVSLILPEGTITFSDYYWTEQDYCTCFAAAGFTLVSVNYPLGKPDEVLDWKWQDETKVAPYVIFVLKN